MPENDTPKNPEPMGTVVCDPAPKNPGTPGDGITDLKNQLADLDQQTKRRDALKADLGVLESAAKQLNQTLSDYQQKYESLKQDFKDLNDYWTSKNVMINAGLGDKGKAIDKKIKDEVQDEIDKKQKEIDTQTTEKKKATDSYNAAQVALSKCQDDFDKAMKFKTELDQQVQTVKQFKTLIDQEEKNNKLANMYFYATELKKALDAAKLQTPDEVTVSLNKAWTDLSQAKTDVRESKLKLDQIIADLDAKQKALTDLNQKRTENILKAIEGLNQ